MEPNFSSKAAGRNDKNQSNPSLEVLSKWFLRGNNEKIT
jgi:hypothetical protein